MPTPKKTGPVVVNAVAQHTIRVPARLEKRVLAAMELEGLRTYNDFVTSALTHRCRAIERDHENEPKPKG